MTVVAPSQDSPRDCRFVSLEDIPLDIAHLIADHSSVQDVMTLSTVSKSLRDLLDEPGMWRKLYRKNSALLLPAGPYDWQSTSYLVSALLHAEKLYSVWPSSSSRPEILCTRTVSLGSEVILSILFGRWLLVAEGSTLVCYDSQCNNIQESAKTLFNEDAGRHIVRIFNVGSVREKGVVAFVVLLFKDSYIIARIHMQGGKPSSFEIILTSTSIPVQGWTNLVHVQLYDRFFVMNIRELWDDWDSLDHLIIMDIDTLRRYHIPASARETAFHPMLTVLSFFATKTHLVKIQEYDVRSRVRFKMECFPLPTPHETPDDTTLHLSHQSRIICGPKLRQCNVIYEPTVGSESGKISFALCGLNEFSDTGRLEVVDFYLDPDGSVSFSASVFDRRIMKSLCIGLSRQHACGVGLGKDGKPLVFALDYRRPQSVSFKYSILDRRFPDGELVAQDAFRGTVFFSHRSSQHTSIEMVDFTSDARKVEGFPSEEVPSDELNMKCDCGECYAAV